jgi:ribonuclease BN (tRNA processing enzyme)
MPAPALTILGTATPYPRPDQPCSGYLVTTPNARVWVEAGSGTFAALQRSCDLSELDALWFSHMHPDHAGDLPALASWLLNWSDQQSALRVYGPPGWLNHLSAFLPTSPEALKRRIDVHELYDGHTTTVRDLRLVTRAVRHSVQAYGARFEVGPHVLAYSGDTGPCPELGELADQATVLLCEAGASSQPIGCEPAHCTPEDAATAAQQANVRRLLLTHLAPTLDPAAALARAASIHHDTALAMPGTVHEL